MKLNKKPIDHRVDTTSRLAGGYGPFAAKQGGEALLRRSVLACLLWENLAYENGQSVADNIVSLVPQVEPDKVAEIAIEARAKQKLRHVPLLIAREMAKYDTHRKLVGDLLPKIVLRPDELTEFLAIYWKDGKTPLAKQVKKGLARAFNRFDAYSLAKWNRDNEIKLRDVMFLVHPEPSQGKEELFKQLAENTLPTPDTWEVSLSTGKDKKATWTRLICDKKIGALAFVRNIRNMEEVGVDRKTIQFGFDTINPRWLLPLNYLAAAKYAPKWERELETLMLKGLSQAQKLPGYTVFVVDVSGSMTRQVSEKSEFSRMDSAFAMAILAAELCEHVAIYATAGNDSSRIHATKIVKPRRGFALMEELQDSANRLGGGGIFTRQCLEFIREKESEKPDRIIVFSDSQDCDWPGNQTPYPFGNHNYIVDVSANQHGINYEGVWDAEISGWSEHFLTYITAFEGVEVAQGEEE